ncbi:50S ribosomal protein L23 [subsurface metagenome]
MDASKIIIEPVVTEKTNVLKEEQRYVFKVDTRANKIQVMKAVRDLFDVHPVCCNIIMVKRKPKRQRYKLGYTASWKKAIVTLPAGETIKIFEGV